MSVPSWVANWALVAIGGWPKGMQLNLTRFVTRLIVLTALTSRGKPTSLEYKTNQLNVIIFFFPCTGSCVVDAPSLLKRFHLRTKMIFKHDLRRTKKKVKSRVRSRIHLNLQLWICHEDANFDSVIWNQLIHNQARWILIWGLFHLQVFNPECLIWDFVWIIWKYFSILNWCTTTLLDNTN